MKLPGSHHTVFAGDTRRKVGSLQRAISPVVGGLRRRRRVPVVLQLSELECGAACLTMVLEYHGRKTRLEEVRERCGVGRDGLTAFAIVETARAYGLRVKAYSMEPTDLGRVRLPAIAHWNFNHFVVVERWSPKGVTIVDPTSGRRRVKASEFDAAFTGVVLTFEPGISFERRHTAGRSAWWSYLRYALRAPGTTGVLAQVLGASLLLTILGLAVPLFTKVLVDRILPLGVTSVMNVLGLGVLVVGLALLVSSYLRAALLVYLQARLDSQMMLGFFEHVLSLPFRFFQQRSSGDLLMRLGSNAAIRQMLTNQTSSVVLDGGLTVAYAAILLTQAPLFGATALAIGLVQVTVLLGTTRRMNALMKQDLSAQAESEGYLVEALTGIATLKASGAEDRAMEHWSNLFFKQLNASLRREQLSAAIGAMLSTLGTLSPLILLWVGALYVLEGGMSLGTMLALNALAASFLRPLGSLVSAGQELQLVGAYLARIADVVEAESEQDIERVEKTPPLTGRLELRQVSFRYDPNAPWALRNISVAIEPGQKVALVGRTGSGKSTLAKLLLGLYNPSEGELLYDGIPLQRLNLRTLRSQFGVVLQESSLFNESLRENIAFNDPDLPLEAVMEAAHLACIHDEIARMPMGYETLIAEDGSALSGGQRQRVSLARALARKPALLVLDEATSHLDMETERLVDQNVSALACTRVVVAHRLSTVRNADKILVLEAGEIVESGSHEQLLAVDGPYAALIRDQSASEETGKVSLPSPPKADGSPPVGFGDPDFAVASREDRVSRREEERR